MHGVAAGQLDLVSGDAPGTTSKYIEDSFDDKIVALWSSGAAGDQNPIYFQQTYDLREIRIKDYAKRGVDISNSMPPGGQGLNKKDPDGHQADEPAEADDPFDGAVPGRRSDARDARHGPHGNKRSNRWAAENGSVPRPRSHRYGTRRFSGNYKEAAPVDIRLGLLKVGDIAIGAVNAEVFNLIAQRLKKESPYARTMMATLTNGSANSGYIPNDAAYGMYTFEVVSSRLQPGCAETAIVNGILDLMSESKK